MIERLQGTVVAKGPEGVVVDVGGVGFLVEVSGSTLRDVPAVGEQTSVFGHLYVREDALQLFGFSSEEERELFRLLLGVSKIGPKLALAVLSCRRAPGLKKALASGDVALLASVPGIGRKTAERIILELREKMGEMGLEGPPAHGGGGSEQQDDMKLVARAALMELGYSVQEAEKLLAPLDAGDSVEDLVRRALTR